MPRERDPFTNFERVRREIDELFGDLWTRAGFHRQAFRPRVDVYYCKGSPKAVVKADLAGVEIESVNLEVRGKTVVISGERRPRDSEGRVYQQIEIEYGPFLREIELGVDVDPERAEAIYQNGILRVELPLAEPTDKVRHVPISGAAKGSKGEDAA